MAYLSDGYDSRFDEYEQPCIIFGEARDLDELSLLFEEDFADLPFTSAEEEMLPRDLTTST